MTNQISSFIIDANQLVFKDPIGIDEDAAYKELCSAIKQVVQIVLKSADLIPPKNIDGLLTTLSKRIQLYENTFVPFPTDKPTPEETKAFAIYNKLVAKNKNLAALNCAKGFYSRTLNLIKDLKKEIDSNKTLDVPKEIKETSELIDQFEISFCVRNPEKYSFYGKGTALFLNKLREELQKVKDLQNPKAEIVIPVPAQPHVSNNNNNNAVVSSKIISDNKNVDAEESIKACFDKLNHMVSTPTPDWSSFAKALKSEGQKLWGKGFSNLEHLLQGITYFHCEKKKHTELHVGGERLIAEGKLASRRRAIGSRSAARIILATSNEDMEQAKMYLHLCG